MSFLGQTATSPIINSFNIGTDLLSLTIVDNVTGATVLLDGKKDMFTSQSADEVIKKSTIDNGGLPDHRVVPNGWTGSLRMARANGNFGAYFAFLEQNFYDNGTQHYCTVTSSVQSSDGTSVERFQYQNLVFHNYKPGDFEKMKAVDAEINFSAQQRVQI